MPPVVPPNQPSPPRSHAWIWWLIGALVVVTVAAGAYWVYILPSSLNPEVTATPIAVSGDVQWQVWEQFTGAMFLPSYEGCEQGKCEEDYLIGEFTGGPYVGGKLYLVFPTDGMGGAAPFLFVRMPNNRDTLLERDSTQYYQGQDQKLPFAINRDYAIPELQIPSLLTSPDGKLVLERQPRSFFGPGARWDELGKGTMPLAKVFTDPVWGDVYTDTIPTTPLPTPGPNVTIRPGFNGFYVRLPSGTLALYSERIDFMQNGVPMGVRWNSGVYAGNEYIWTGYGGCGANNLLEIVFPYQVDAVNDLKEIGRTPANEPILTFRDPNHAYLRNIYDTQYFVMEPQQKISYDQFVAGIPVFFWRDPLGRLVRFESKLFLPQAECGKPVIYLYPKQTTLVSVKVQPVGGMTFSEPAYGEGWTVTAQPDGRLTDSRGMKWPYLFWEGRGGLYEQPGRGWVVARANVEQLLDEKLASLGLIGHEISDFKEFWLPRMQSAPYYFVTFLGNQAMDELAPLSVNPVPDAVIRVLMDFSPLLEPKTVMPYTIHTPARKGFTVVEWGGVLR